MKPKVSITFNNEAYELALPSTLTGLKQNINALYTNLPIKYKIRYKDEEDDLITITNQSDYEFAYSSVKENIMFMIYGEKEKLKVEDVAAQKEESKNEVNAPAIEILGKEDFMPSIYACIRCKGTTLTKKGRPCKICNATGQMPKDLEERVRQIVKKELKEIIKTEASLYTSKLAQSQRVSSNSVHYDIICQHCKIKPITGIRYNCPKCKSFDLCELCEQNSQHEHPMCKIRRPNQPVYKNSGKLYDMKIVSESSINSENVVEKGNTCIKEWIIMNTGRSVWPEETILVIENLIHNKDMIQKIGKLEPKEIKEVSVEFKAPMEVGSYCFFCQLHAGKGIKFGNTFNLEFKVKDSTELSEKEIVARLGNIDRRYI